MIIIGAGMAGLLAGGMIRSQKVTIYELSKKLPNNHSAVLRFRSTIVGDTLGIEFQAVKMIKCVEPWINPVADSLAYSLKCNGKATLRSILSANAEMQLRYIAPPNLIQLMADRINGGFEFGREIDLDLIKNCGTPIISTMPMHSLMKLLNYTNIPEFNFVHGFNISAGSEALDAYATVYVPDPKYKFNRVSAVGDRLTIEYSKPNVPIERILELVGDLKINWEHLDEEIQIAADLLGLKGTAFRDVEIEAQRYSKILPIDEGERKRFLLWATENYNIFSLGRFATWRPGLLLDDLVNDVRVIQKIIKHGTYDSRKKG